MSHVVLGLLFAVGPQSIYSLNKFFEAGISLFYAASLGALRQTLLRLLEEGHVTVSESRDGGRAKKVYTITDTGREQFLAWMRAPISDRKLEVVALSKLYFLGALRRREDRRIALRSIVDRARADEAQLLAIAPAVAAAEVPEQYRDLARYQRLTLDYGLQSHALGRDFFERLLAEEEEEEDGQGR